MHTLWTLSRAFGLIQSRGFYLTSLSPVLAGLPKDVGPKELGSVRALINRLNTVLTAEDINAEKEREIKKRIADVQLQLEPFEEVGCTNHQ